MKMKHLIAVTLVLCLIFPLTNAMSLGVSPPRIIKENLLPDSRFQEIITISKDDDKSVKIQAVISGETKEWIKTPPEIIFPKNTKRLQVPIDIYVPKDVELDEYSAKIEYFIIEETNPQMAFSVPIQLAITDEEYYQYTVKHVKAKQEESDTVIYFEVHNDGNVFSGPTEVEIEVIDALKQNSIYKEKEKTKQTAPSTITEKDVAFNTKLNKGNYWVNVRLTDNNQEYYETVFLEIESDKTTGNVITEIQTETPRSSRYDFWMLILLILPLVALMFIAFTKRKK